LIEPSTAAYTADLFSTETAATVFEYHTEQRKGRDSETQTEVFQIALEIIITFYMSYTGALVVPSPGHLACIFIYYKLYFD